MSIACTVYSLGWLYGLLWHKWQPVLQAVLAITFTAGSTSCCVGNVLAKSAFYDAPADFSGLCLSSSPLTDMLEHCNHDPSERHPNILYMAGQMGSLPCEGCPLSALTAADAEKARASRNIRRGKGKMRNRRYTTRKGPLVVYSEDSGIVRAFRNIPGVDVARVDRLNLLQVCILKAIACAVHPHVAEAAVTSSGVQCLGALLAAETSTQFFLWQVDLPRSCNFMPRPQCVG